MEKTQKIFISHSSKDNLFANELKKQLEDNGFETWFDKYDLIGGTSFPIEIISKISECDFFCIILSPQAMKSPWVRFELGHVLYYYVQKIKLERAYIIPILLTACDIWSEILPLHYLNFITTWEFPSLIDTLKKPKSNDLFSRQNEFRPPIKEHINLLSAPKDYIERGLSKDGQKNYNYYFDNQNLSLETLLMLVQKHCYICVLSDAGVGKSTELCNLAFVLSNNEMPYQPFYYELNKYSGEDIISYIPKLKTTLSGYAVLILDGYDEIDNSFKKQFLRKLERFIDDFPLVSIIISSRGNLKPDIKNFEYFHIKELSDIQIKNYCNKKTIGDNFLDYFTKSELYELLRNPFYLVNLVKLYNQSKSLPKSKTQLFDELITIHLNTDQTRNNKNDNFKKYENYQLIELLQKIAIIIETSGKRFIKENDLINIINREEKEISKHCGIFEVTKEDPPIWRFTHNLFQEYCAAFFLSKYNFFEIKKIICFPPDYNKLKPTWLNTLSFLLDIWGTKNFVHDTLIKEIFQISESAVLTIETNSISDELRSKIFFSVYNYYCDKEMRIDINIVRNLAVFGNQHTIIAELFDLTFNSSNALNVINFCEICQNLTIPLPYKSVFKQKFLKIFDRFYEDKNICTSLIYAACTFDLTNDEFNDAIFSKITFPDDSSIRSAIYYYLIQSNTVDFHINYILTGISFLGQTTLNTFDSDEESRLVDETYFLGKCLGKCTEYYTLAAIIDYFILHPESITEFDTLDTLDNIISSSSNIYISNPIIYDKLKFLYIKFVESYLDSAVNKLKRFFIDTNTRNNFINYIYTERMTLDTWYRYLDKLVILSDVAFFAEEYNIGNLTTENILILNNFLNASSLKNDSFLKEINNLVISKIEKPYQFDFEAHRKEVLENDIELLLDRNKYLDKVTEVLNYSGNALISKEDIHNYRHNNFKNSIGFSDLVPFNLIQLLKEQPRQKEEITNTLNNYLWLDFQIIEFFKLIKNKKDLSNNITISNLIVKWCNEKVVLIDFRTALSAYNDGGLSTKLYADMLWYFIRYNYYCCSEDVLLDLLSFDWVDGNNNGGIKYIEEKVSKEKIKERILINMANGISVGIVWENHLDFCVRNKIHQAAMYAFEILKNTNWTSSLINKALDCILTFSDNRDTASKLIEEIAQKFRWILFDRLNQYPNLLIKALTNILNNEPEQEKLKAAKLLIKLNQLNGINYYINNIIKNKKAPSHDYSDESLRIISHKGALPSLCKLLEISFNKSFIEDDYFSVKNRILDSLKTIIIKNNNLEEVVTKLNKIIKRNKNTNPQITSINYFIEDLTKQYYQNKSENISIQDAIILVEGLTKQKWSFKVLNKLNIWPILIHIWKIIKNFLHR